jgi:hypothetical protein
MTPSELADVLESGKYIKGKGTLARTRNDGTIEYCCLGVYAVESEIPYEWAERIDDDESSSRMVMIIDDQCGDLAQYQPDWMGVIPPRENADISGQLVAENDSHDTWEYVIKLLRNLP